MKKSVLWILLLLLVVGFYYLVTQNDKANDILKNTANVVINTTKDAAESVKDDTADLDEDIASGANAVIDEAEELGDDIASGADAALEDAEELGDDIEDALTADTQGYEDFDSDVFTQALAEGQKVALFFYADWCPNCRALDENLEENEDLIPDDTVIYKVDYDTEAGLKERYVVTSQHTIVVVDANADALSSNKNITTTDELLELF